LIDYKIYFKLYVVSNFDKKKELFQLIVRHFCF